MAEFERELYEILDELDEAELDTLIGDIELEADRQPDLTGLFDGKGHKAMKRNIKKKTAATIAALAAALGITATAGAAVLTNGFKGADHDKAVANVLGEGNVTGEAKTDSTGHLKIREEKIICGEKYAQLIISLEPVDEIGQQYTEENKIIGLSACTITDDEGMHYGFNEGPVAQVVSDGCMFIGKGIHLDRLYRDPDWHGIGDRVLNVKTTLELGMNDENIINGEGDPISQIEFELKKNTSEPIVFKGDKGGTMTLNEIEMCFDSHFNDFAKAQNESVINEDRAVCIDLFRINFKDGTSKTYDEATADVTDSPDFDYIYNGDGTYTEKFYGDNIGFGLMTGQTDPENVASVDFYGEHFEVEQN